MYIYGRGLQPQQLRSGRGRGVILLLVTIVLSYGVTRWTNRSDRPEATR